MRSLLISFCVLLVSFTAHAQDPKFNDFVSKFTKAMEFDDTKSMDRAVRSGPEPALRYFSGICWSWKEKNDDANRKILDTLNASWKRAFDTETLDKYERYISGASEKLRKSLHEYEVVRNKILTGYYAIRADGRRQEFESYRDSALKLAEACESVGHALFAAENWSLVAVILIAIPERTVQDREYACFAMEQFISQRKNWDWTEDTSYKQNVAWLKGERGAIVEAKKEETKRADAGFSGDIKGAEGLVDPMAEEEIARLEFAVQKKEPQDMFARGGGVRALWLGTQTKEGTGPAKIGWFRQRDIFLVRTAATKFAVTTDGNKPDGGPGRQAIEVSSKYRPSEFFITADKSERYAMWFYLGTASESAMGLSHHLAPYQGNATVYYKSAASWTTSLAGEKITFYDDNCDGKLATIPPYDYGLKFRTFGDVEKEVSVVAFDSMAIGKGKRIPWSSFVKLKDSWFHLRGKDDPSKMGVRPLHPEFFSTGTIQMKWKGSRTLKPAFLIVRGSDEFGDANFDIASGKAVEVPASTYRIAFGRMTSGKGVRLVEGHIYQGDMPKIEVKKGENTVITLGSPFQLDFKRGGDGDKVSIDATSIRILGAAGELYSRMSGATPTPEVVCAKSDSGKGAKAIAEFMMMDIEQLNRLSSKSKLSMEVGFYPVLKGDLQGNQVFEGTLPFKSGVVGLRQKRHKVFGKFDPIWK